MFSILLIMLKCEGIKRNGEKCTNKAKEGLYCGIHMKKALKPIELKVNCTAYTPPVFSTDEKEAEQAKQYMEDNGYVVFSDVITEEDLEKGIDLLWEMLERMNTGIVRDDTSTFTNDNWPNTFSNGIIDQYGVGQSPFMWHNRSRKGVKRAFSIILQEEDLVVSYDAFNIFRKPPHKITGLEYHVDQGRNLLGKQCIQGLITYYPSSEHTGGLTVIPGSHLHHDEVILKSEKNSNFVMLKSKELVWGDPVLLSVPARSLILWDSRTIHGNTSYISSTPCQDYPLLRLVAYVCMMPRSKIPEDIMQQRKDSIGKSITTSHWPNQFCKKRPPRFPRKGKVIEDVTPLPFELMTDDMKSLI